MPRPVDEILAKITGRGNGWENASANIALSGEKFSVMDKGDGSDSKVLVSRARRVYYRDTNGSLLPIDTSWRKTGNRPWTISNNRYTIEIGGGRPNNSTFNSPNLINYKLDNHTFSLTHGSGMTWENGVDSAPALSASDVVGTLRGGLDDNRIVWANAYGVGINYEIVSDTDQVWSRIIIPDVANLGVPRISGDVYLSIPHTATLSANIDIYYVNDLGQKVLWDKVKPFSTDGAIELRDTVTGNFLMALRRPFLRSETFQIGSGNRQVLGGTVRDQLGKVIERVSWYEVSTNGATININECFDYSIMSAIVGEFYLDPTIDTEAVGDTSDAEQNTYGSAWNTGKNYADVAKYGGGNVRWAANFDISAISAGDTIDVAYMVISTGGKNTDISIRVVEEADHTFPASYAASTTAVSNWSANSVAWVPTGFSGPTGINTPSIVTLVEDCINAGGAVGEIGLWMEGVTGSITVLYLIGYAGYQEAIHIEYTAGGGGSVIGQLVGGKLVNNGILSGRLVGRR